MNRWDQLREKCNNTAKDNPFWKYRDKTIMKFRFSSVMRVFGYRRGDRFRVIRFERDHRLSDNGQIFDVDRSVVKKYLRNIFKEGELDEDSTCANFAQVADNGKNILLLRWINDERL